MAMLTGSSADKLQVGDLGIAYAFDEEEDHQL